MDFVLIKHSRADFKTDNSSSEKETEEFSTITINSFLKSISSETRLVNRKG